MALAPIINSTAHLITPSAAPQAPGVSVRNYKKEEELQRIRDERLHAQQLERDTLQDKSANASWEYRYSQKQKMDLEKLRNAYADLQGDMTMSAEDKKAMGDQILGQIYGVKKLPYEIEKEDAATRRQTMVQDREYELKKNEYDIRRQEAEQKRADAMAAQLMRPRTETRTGQNKYGEPIQIKETIVPTWDEVQPQLAKMFPNVYGVSGRSGGTAGADDAAKAQKFLDFFSKLKAGQAQGQTQAASPTTVQPSLTTESPSLTTTQPSSTTQVQPPTTQVQPQTTIPQQEPAPASVPFVPNRGAGGVQRSSVSAFQPNAAAIAANQAREEREREEIERRREAYIASKKQSVPQKRRN